MPAQEVDPRQTQPPPCSTARVEARGDQPRRRHRRWRVIGLVIAWRRAQRGLGVTSSTPAPGGGASRTAAGMLAPVTELHYGERPARPQPRVGRALPGVRRRTSRCHRTRHGLPRLRHRRTSRWTPTTGRTSRPAGLPDLAGPGVGDADRPGTPAARAGAGGRRARRPARCRRPPGRPGGWPPRCSRRLPPVWRDRHRARPRSGVGDRAR